MQKIIFPLQQPDEGPEVANLHLALMELAGKLKSAEIEAFLSQKDLAETFERERERKVYGQATRQVIGAFQEFYMRVSVSGVVDEATSNALNKLLEQFQLVEPTPPTPQQYSVSGTVYDKWIAPLPGALVKGFAKDIRSERPIGEATTDHTGAYVIDYYREKVDIQGPIDLFVRLYDASGKAVFSTDVYFNAGAQLRNVNINLGPRPYMGPSEFQTIVTTIKPLLGKLEIAGLVENSKIHDLTYLNSKTKLAVGKLLQLVAAFKFETLTKVPAEVFYGILGQNRTLTNNTKGATDNKSQPVNSDALIDQAYATFWNSPVQAMMAAFQRAATRNIITYKLCAEKEKIQESLQKLKVSPPKLPGSTAEVSPTYSKLTIAGLAAGQQHAFLNAYDSGTVGSDLWATLAKDPNFSGAAGSAALDKIKIVFQISGWTADNTDLTKYVVSQYKINSAADINALISYNENDWVNIIHQSGEVPNAGVNPQATILALAENIAAGVETMYPTAVFSDRFTKSKTLNISNKDYIGAVLKTSDFDILKSPVSEYIDTYVKKTPLPAGTAQKAVTNQIMGLQRIYKTVQHADKSVVLLSANIQSARQIYVMGQSNFLRKFQDQLGGPEKTQAIYERAANIHAGASYLSGKMVSTFNNPPAKIMKDYGSMVPASTFAKNYPDLANLFGVGPTYCECTDCDSFLGIPAYLVDLLDYLKERQTTTGSTARAMLLANRYKAAQGYFRRRPDIGDIDLTCQNTDVELPYIDIVNELLEDYIIPPIAALVLDLTVNDPKQLLTDFILWIITTLAAGQITDDLYKLLMKIGEDPKTPICNISLLTKNAIVSDLFFSENENYPSWITEALVPQWMIRDQFITLKLTIVISEETIINLPQYFGKDIITIQLDPPVGKKDTPPQRVAAIYNEKNQNFQQRQAGFQFALIVQEVHETHLSAADISANPEYTNTNVYNCLSLSKNLWNLYPGRIPITLPFDLYFTQANTFLEKMGKKRYDLMTIFEKQSSYPLLPTSSLAGNSKSIIAIARSYFDLSDNEWKIIVTETNNQAKFWGKVLTAGLTTPASTNQPEVDLFLSAAGIDFEQLRTLLTLKFINGNGSVYIAYSISGLLYQERERPTIYDTCNTSFMVIANMTLSKFDRINRFLRLWNKLNTLMSISMLELDRCIMSAAIGLKALDEPFTVGLYHFCSLMSQMSLTATQTLALFQVMDTSDDGNLYQQLFQNRQISNPIVPAFTNLLLPTPPPVTKIADTQSNPGVIPVILTACGITQDDLTAILSYNNSVYSDFTIDNLSIIYACGLLADFLSCSVADLLSFTQLTGINPLWHLLPAQPAANPGYTVNFITWFNDVITAGLTVDGINYLLTNQSNATPSLIPDASTVIAGLTAMRAEVQAANSAATPAPDPKGVMLKKWLADPDLNWDPAVAMTLTTILGNIGTGNYVPQVLGNLRFLQLLQTKYAQPNVTAYLNRLPAINLPDNSISAVHYDSAGYFLFYYGTMSKNTCDFLVNQVVTDAASQTAVQSLYAQSQLCAISAIPLAGFTVAAPPAWLGAATKSVPGFSAGNGALGFKGQMNAPVYLTLRAQSADPYFSVGVDELFLASQGAVAAAMTYVRLEALPAMALPGKEASLLAYSSTTQLLSINGSLTSADLRSLLSLSADGNFQSAVCRLYTSSRNGEASSTPLPALPGGWPAIPDLAGLSALSFGPGTLSSTGAIAPPALCFSGQMTSVVQTAFNSLSPNANWQTAVNSLFTGSQSAEVATADISALPAGVTPASFPLFGVQYVPPAGANPARLSYQGVMSGYVLDELIAANNDPNWAALVTALYQNTQNGLVSSVQLPMPAGLTAASFAGITGITCAVAGATCTLSSQGQMLPSTRQQLLALSPDPNLVAAVSYLFSQISSILPFAPPPINIAGLDANLSSINYKQGAIVFTGTPSPDCMDEFNLEQLNPDPLYSDAISFIYDPTTAANTIGVALTSLPPVTLPTGVAIAWANGYLNFTGQMQVADFQKLFQLSNDPSFLSALASLIVTIPAWPTGWATAAADVSAQGVASFAYTIGTTNGIALSFVGPMNIATLNALLTLNPDGVYQAAVYSLYNQSQNTVVQTTPLATLPPVALPALPNIGFNTTCSVLYYSGVLPVPPASIATLKGLSSTVDYQAAITAFGQITANPGQYLVCAPPPQTPFATSGITLAKGATIAYQDGTLNFTAKMSFEDYLGLLAISPDSAYQNAITDLFVSSQTNPTSVSGNYLSLPPISIPAIYSNQLTYSPATSTLLLRGMINTADQSALNSLGSSYAWQQALGSLVTAATPTVGFAGGAFGNMYESLLPLHGGVPSTPDATTLYAWFLNKIAIVYQPLKQADAVAAQLASLFGLSAAIGTILANDTGSLLNQASGNTLPRLLAVMTDSAFTANSKAVNPDPLQSPQACWYLQVARIATLVTAYNISAADLGWLLSNATNFGTLDLHVYPSTTKPLSFSAWENFNAFRLFQNKHKAVNIPDASHPGKTVALSVYSIASAALTISQNQTHVPVIPSNPGDLLGKLIRLTGWDKKELEYLLNIDQHTQANLTLNPLDLQDIGLPALGCIVQLSKPSILNHLSDCFAIAGKLKVVPSRCVVWVMDPVTDVVADDIKQALKSLYPDVPSWTSAIVPLMNTLRQNRRDALVAYLLSNTVTNPFGHFDVFADVYGIYGNFLIDPEMSACQPTTRVIQAYCAIQAFVQRCLLNVEAPVIVADTTKDADWNQWAWMGTFETWYAARYTLLFPENLIIPQALPYQSDLFKNLQNDLTQGPVTAGLINTAFGNFIQDLDEIGRLKMMGQWYDHPTSTLYVFACTYGGDPAVYYFRTQNLLGMWSNWEKITADISGDTIVPLVQNGRLYLYWPVFSKASDDDKGSQPVPASGGNGTTAPPPIKYWKVQMAFSEYLNGQWTGKKVSKDFLTTCNILSSSGNPSMFPDTPDFVFIPLDLPVYASDPVAGTLASLQNNGTLFLAGYQPTQVTITFTLAFISGTPTFWQSFALQLNVATPTFAVQSLLDEINASILVGGKPTTYSSKAYIDPATSDPVGILQKVLNSLVASGDSIVVISITYSPVPGTDLSLMSGSVNSFLLDPARGFATAVDINAYGGNITHTLPIPGFDGSVFVNMLDEGNLPLSNSKAGTILASGNDSFANLLPWQMSMSSTYHYLYYYGSDGYLQMLGTKMPFFYQDSKRTFFVNEQDPYYHASNYLSAEMLFLLGQSNPAYEYWFLQSNFGMGSGPQYQFYNYYHPFIHYFIKIFAQKGLAPTVSRDIQLTGDPIWDPIGGPPSPIKSNLIYKGGYKSFDFTNYNPTSVVNAPYPIEEMDFGAFTAYSEYNWEFFFHAILFSALQLSQNQQFADADRMFKLIFNPTDTSSEKAPYKFWETKPFYENINTSLSLDDQILLYEANPASQQAFQLSVEIWKNDPFDPHILALLRTTPYMYATFMKYLDNLIAWANYNYAQYTMESVNIALQLLMQALESLGTKPEAIPPINIREPSTYYQMELDLEILMAIDGPEGYLSDPIVAVENLIPPAPPVSGSPSPGGNGQKLPKLPGLYFCIPPNEVLLRYWDTIETQLYKIRHCLNIEGKFQPLSPFPNVPGLAGLDGSGVNDFGGVIPNYRFSVMVEKATDFCNEVKQLGASLLSSLEKQDSEGLALLHSTQEIAVQQSVDKVKQLQITDAEFSLQNLQNYESLLQDKITYYSGLLQNGGLIPLEQQALTLNQLSLALQGPIMAGTLLSSALKLVPNFNLGASGFGGSPVADVDFGGAQLSGAADMFVQMMQFLSQFSDKAASIATTNAGYTRRSAEWNFQLTLAQDELIQVKTQIQAAQNKITIAKQEEQNQQLLIQNAQDVDSMLRTKYTNQQLYSWMVTQISNVYFQSYQLAYGVAKQAEICFRYELGITNTSYINYGYWDTLHKGLTCGELLMSSIKRMSADYLTQDAREYEITKQISLAQLDPYALQQLKYNNVCYVNIPEELFDFDYPGQYFRRIKHIAVTLPGVVGPYTAVSLKLTLLNNSVRVDNTAGSVDGYPRRKDSTGAPTSDNRFLDNVSAMQFMVTSNGVNDNGLFELNLRDERYVPFERGGAISTWRVEATSVYAQFDPESISDLIIHFSYTARDGGAALQSVAAQSIQKKLAGAMATPGLILMRAFSAKRDFPTQWYKFLNPVKPTDLQELDLNITKRLPFFAQDKSIKITSVVTLADVPANGDSANDPLATLYMSGTKLKNSLLNFGPNPQFGDTVQYSVTNCRDAAGVWKITNGTVAAPAAGPIQPGDINDLIVIFYYNIKVK